MTKKEVLDALTNFSTALQECKMVCLQPEVPTDQVAVCLELMAAGVEEVRKAIAECSPPGWVWESSSHERAPEAQH